MSLRQHSKDNHLSALLEASQLDISDVRGLFHLMDHDDTDAIDIDVFIVGCRKLMGEAEAIDKVRIQVDIDQVLKVVLDRRRHSSADHGQNSPYTHGGVTPTSDVQGGEPLDFGDKSLASPRCRCGGRRL